MKYKELSEYRKKEYLEDGYEEVIAAAKPFFEKLIDSLIKLSEDASKQERLTLFRHCIEDLNQLDEKKDMVYGIDTVERDEFCKKLYQIGEIVGLDPNTRFVDHWRN